MGRPKGSTKELILTRTHKVCGKCKHDKKLTEFSKSSRHGDGHRTECKSCRNLESKRAYANDYSGKRTKMQERYARCRKFLNEAKDKPCADCKQKFPPPVMHFHHRNPTDKIIEVAKLVQHKTDTLQAEIDKCDVICANCHIIRHLKDI